MLEGFTQAKLIEKMKKVLGRLPDSRKGKNTRYKMIDAGMAAFSVFFTQNASFLEHQRYIKTVNGRSNAESMFGMVNIPSDNQIRNILDPVTTDELNPLYREVVNELDKGGILEPMRSFSHNLLVAIDGTEYHSSDKIHCDKCNKRKMKNGEINYYHTVITPVIVKAGCEHVISLEPEFITPQDGHEKQDCEIAAPKRNHGADYAKMGVMLLGYSISILTFLLFLLNTFLYYFALHFSKTRIAHINH